jgi:predicted MPP superfamily phosphohydrolase
MVFGKKKRARKQRRKTVLVLIFLVFIFGIFVFDSNTRIVTEEYPITSLKLPDSFNGYRIVQLSDLHGKSFGKDNSQLVAAVKEAKPDIIVITGDLIEDKNSGAWARILLTKLKEIAPVYFVTGNHEWASGGLVELFEIIKDCGVTALRNDYLMLTKGKDSIVLAGVDDPNGFADQKTPKQLYSEIKSKQPAAYSILLAHRNNLLDTYAAIGADLVLTGHSHGGIIRLPFIGGIISTDRSFISKYDAGFFIKDKTVMFVSRGLGPFWNIPRFLNNPEIAVLILKK